MLLCGFPMLTFEDVRYTKPERLLHWPLGRFKCICKQTGGERWGKMQWPEGFLFASSSFDESKVKLLRILTAQPPIRSESWQELLWKHSTLTHSSMCMNTEVPVPTWCRIFDIFELSVFLNLWSLISMIIEQGKTLVQKWFGQFRHSYTFYRPFDHYLLTLM